MIEIKCRYAFGKECQVAECKYEPCVYPLVYQQGRADAKAELEEHDKQIRAKVIDVIYPMIRKLGSSKRIDNICEKMEQLKEHNNEQSE